MNSLEKVRVICKTVGGLRPDPSITEDEWAEWMDHWEGFPKVAPCPECDGHLVEKRGIYGPFLGCSNYPDCKHTQSV